MGWVYGFGNLKHFMLRNSRRPWVLNLQARTRMSENLWFLVDLINHASRKVSEGSCMFVLRSIIQRYTASLPGIRAKQFGPPKQKREPVVAVEPGSMSPDQGFGRISTGTRSGTKSTSSTHGSGPSIKPQARSPPLNSPRLLGSSAFAGFIGVFP